MKPKRRSILTLKKKDGGLFQGEQGKFHGIRFHGTKPKPKQWKTNQQASDKKRGGEL